MTSEQESGEMTDEPSASTSDEKQSSASASGRSSRRTPVRPAIGSRATESHAQAATTSSSAHNSSSEGGVSRIKPTRAKSAIEVINNAVVEVQPLIANDVDRLISTPASSVAQEQASSQSVVSAPPHPSSVLTSAPSSALGGVPMSAGRLSGRGATSSGMEAALSGNSHSGGEASAASSRSYLPLQSKASLYRQQASASSSISNERMADSQIQRREGSGLSRAKSVSSVSSVNSTSSMEAVPFRAAPMGNVRVGFGGYARARMEGRQTNRRVATSNEDGTEQSGSNAGIQATADGIDQSSRPEGSVQGRQRILPKGPSDDWQYRNAPGLGSRSKADSVSGQAAYSPTFMTSIGRGDGTESDGSSMHDVRPPVKGTFRSKIAKRAGKLGLKPLTSVQITSSSSPLQPPNVVIRGDPLGDETGKSAAAASLTLHRLTSAKSYLKDMSTLHTGPDVESPRAHSSVTSAPLVVPKYLPGPPGSGPPPSPGLVGAGTYANLGTQATALSPFELAGLRIDTAAIDPLDDLSGDLAREAHDGDAFMPQQPPSANGLGNLLTGPIIAQSGVANRNSLNSISTSSSRATTSTPSPSLTPAQVIQMEARAGIATLPAGPSGAGPVPGDELEVERFDKEAVMNRRPMSASVSTQATARPNVALMQRWSSGSSSARQSPTTGGTGGGLRPNLLRALTSDSFGKRSQKNGGKDETQAPEDDAKRAQSPISPTAKSDSLSPKSSAAVSSKASGSPSMLRLEIRDDANDAEQMQMSRSASTQRQRRQLAVDESGAATLLTMDQGLGSHPDITLDAEASDDHKDPLERPRPVSRINSSTTPSELPSIAVTSQSSSISGSSPAPSPIGLPPTSLPSVSPAPIDQPSLNAAISRPVTPSVKDIGSSGTANRSQRVRDDFWFGEMIGEGSYSTVMQAWDILPLRENGAWSSRQAPTDASNALAAIAGKTGNAHKGMKPELKDAKVYAIKILDKVHILKEKKQKYVNVEKQALSLLTRHPGVITLYWTFQDRDSLYFVLEMAPNGELLGLIKRLGSLDETCTRFFSSQLLETLDAIHKAGILHRDIKPENILLASDMHIRVADFGSAKIIGKPSGPGLASDQSDAETRKQRPSSFVGTAEYVSPELLNDKHVSQASDYWAFGCVLYQMLSGRPPFKGASEYQTFQKITRRDLDFQGDFSEPAKDLIGRLLSLDPGQRPTYADIKSHAFFEGVDWGSVWTSAPPTLTAGMYKRPERESVVSNTSSKQGASTASDGIRTDSEASRRTSEEGDKGTAQSEEEERGEGSTSARLHRRNTSAGDEADDDESSLSDSQHQNRSQRKRGFSTSVSATDRLLARTGFTSRGSHLSTDRSPNRDQQSFGSEQRTKDAKMADHGPMSANLTSWAALLLPHESLLYACPVLHKSGTALLRTTMKKRQLLLTDFPRLLCVKETNDELKVKSEVILGVPRSFRGHAVQMQPSLDVQADEYEWSDSPLTKPPRPIFPMRRQSSAGPLLPSSSPNKSSGGGEASGGMSSPQRAFRRQSSTGFNVLQRTSSQATEATTNTISPRNSFMFKATPPNAASSSSSHEPTATPPLSSHPRNSITAHTVVEAVQTSPNIMTSVESKSQKTFVIHTPAKSYQYEDPSGDASHWVKSITMAARRHGEAVTMGQM